MKTTCNAITLRYVHDVVTEEFVNVGVVLYAPEQRFLEARFTTSRQRLDAMFLKIDHQHFRTLMCHMSNALGDLGAQIPSGKTDQPVTSLSEMVKLILPPDESSLQWSEQCGGFTDAPAQRLNELYQRLVERYQARSECEPASMSAGNQTA